MIRLRERKRERGREREREREPNREQRYTKSLHEIIGKIITLVYYQAKSDDL